VIVLYETVHGIGLALDLSPDRAVRMVETAKNHVFLLEMVHMQNTTGSAQP
jgi:hypothetical protein